MSTETTKKPRPATYAKLGLVRFSYEHVFEPDSVEEDGDKKYSVCIILPKSDKVLVAKAKKAIEAAKLEGKSKKWSGKLPAGLKLPLRDGDEERPDDEAFADSYFLNATSKRKPQIVDKKGDLITDRDEFYSGCYGQVSINFYPFMVKGNKGIAAGLNNIQKVKDGERLAGGTSAADDFADDFEYDDVDDTDDTDDGGSLLD